IEVVVLETPERLAGVAVAETREPRRRRPPHRLQVAAPVRNAWPPVADVVRMMGVLEDASFRVREAAFERECLDDDSFESERRLDAARARAIDVLHDAGAAEDERVVLIPD